MGIKKINDGLTKYQRCHQKNKEKRNAYSREYHKKNREEILEKKRAYDKQKNIDNKHKPTVYLLVNENYVGTTENLKNRLSSHKKDYGRDISKVEILGEFDTRQDALSLERKLHSEGYKGKHRFNTYK
tara:strand:- start:46 stop:429 length:384 start_codon:yes stop_codon:yes gene_type:complete